MSPYRMTVPLKPPALGSKLQAARCAALEFHFPGTSKRVLAGGAGDQRVAPASLGRRRGKRAALFIKRRTTIAREIGRARQSEIP